MTTAESCTVTVLHRGGRPVSLIRWGGEPGWTATSRCGDCGVQPGRHHHLGCDVQLCPLCRKQMCSCDCRYDEDGPAGDGLLDSGVLADGGSR